MQIKTFLSLAAVLLSTFLAAQHTKTVLIGSVTDRGSSNPLEYVIIHVEGSTFTAESRQNGQYEIFVPVEKDFNLVFSYTGYVTAVIPVRRLAANEKRKIDVELVSENVIEMVTVTETALDDDGAIRADPNKLVLLPSTTGNLEAVLPSIGLGVSSGTGGELSSQYNVRGGNYDENLIYVNDFEIYRPQLIRTGQQEGLTFANVDLTRDIYFSSGGFTARYGDKLSSVLDVRYKRPEAIKGSFSASLLGASAHFEGALGAAKKLRLLVGARYKTTSYLLGSLDVKGEYVPDFGDVQTHLTYDITKNWQVGYLGNINLSRYSFKPTERNTGFGQYDISLKLNAIFNGKEEDRFYNAFNGLSLTYVPERDKNPMYIKFLGSGYISQEDETYDLINNYLLGQADTNPDSETFGDIISVIGSGTQHDYARNFLDIKVGTFQHRGGIEFQRPIDSLGHSRSQFLQWGVTVQQETIEDNLNEWERLDSALYSLPYNPEELTIYSVVKSTNALQTHRFHGYLQNTFTNRKPGQREWRMDAGLRFSYWDLNKEIIVSPRLQFQYQPLNKKNNIVYRIATGLYSQPPFYREMRRPDGTLNTSLKAQKSLHVVGGATWDFYLGQKYPKKFKLITEAYYKALWDLVSFDIDNVRVRYSGENDATGYAAGIDFRINGEFVPDAESWINLGFLRTREALNGVTHLKRDVGEAEGHEVKDVPRPTDQFANLSMYFQDYMERNRNLGVNVNVAFGTGIPFGIPENNIVYRNTYRFKTYHRVDIGFNWIIWNKETMAEEKPQHFMRQLDRAFLTLEVYNLMGVENVASNTWIRSVFNQQYAVPNHLSGRRVNLRFRIDF